ncbi:aquaporin-11-like [Acanthaster planci]|uniref:Aquaporin n=1 Tax=Acanthaster planci TaxID=133434 RepID=A0A8B7Z9E2_ACAPL|nr:aquaporin-11-like [Acanthaster planci]
MSLVFSLVILLSTFLLTQALRVATSTILPRSIYQFVAEFLCTFQLTSCVYENGIVLGTHGTWVYAFGIFCLGLGYSLTFDAFGNPAAIFEQILKRKISVLNGALKMAAEVVGGLLAFRYMLFVWHTFAPSSVHINHAKMVRVSCVSALQVNLLTGALVEAIAMFVSRSVAGIGLGGPKYYKMVNAFTTAVVVVSGLEWTGMMFNPALATALTYNCKGHQLYEHIIVYWMGPFIGTILSILVFYYIMEEYEQGQKSVPAHVQDKNGLTTKEKTN